MYFSTHGIILQNNFLSIPLSNEIDIKKIIFILRKFHENINAANISQHQSDTKS